MEQHEAIARAWLERTLAAYPPETARFLAATRDPFRNPVGQAYKTGLPVLAAELFGDMDPRRITPALEEIMHIRAVQDLPPAGFLVLLKDLVDPCLHDRIDRLAAQACDVYAACRERMQQIRVNETLRRDYLQRRIRS